VLFGTEKFGITERTVAAVDQHVIIPMMGMVSSFNVSVAAAIILSEACEQRRAAGLYQQRRLSEARYKHAFFRWAHPRLAAYCERYGVPYPALDDEGRIAEPRRFDFLLSEAVRRGEDA
jgi:tRNA (guanosine-2'-O-)-methyltransferase